MSVIQRVHCEPFSLLLDKEFNSVGPVCGEGQLAIHMALLLASGRERVLGFLAHPTQVKFENTQTTVSLHA